ncbi:uncharacterized protein CIMG_10625 [Coccidioides immitis RS]|uniref:Uncharacterized protein n=4 Tax=Coccidioides immitis TaxID=5501 RepID=A0A0D8JSE2_COCIM|nr:uncharacterized protein CIMG_10625 [Coccidioides immitis RS]KMP00732.1 hypothetical protein CIRG_00874 [Coccidioides immitis RMSCC 2394]KMU75604.1 hypothetical protein CISG_05007 [Coccidioides immitis RMSCC 3703]KMU85397.1 hypothetical protein CIHG_03179 [Coccidioides immitis H538.4]TPX26257.1 hypothetical protein DIZ76_011719 [Coccidioides immitis]KJF60260.1 hypothetical protein CIMG_10625 [Coccidioides immitis RS]
MAEEENHSLPMAGVANSPSGNQMQPGNSGELSAPLVSGGNGMSPGPQIGDNMQRDDLPIPDLGTETFLNMSDQEFLAMFESFNNTGYQANPNPIAELPAANIDPPSQPNIGFIPQAPTPAQGNPNEMPGQHTSVPLTGNFIRANAPLGPAQTGIPPHTSIQAIDAQAKAMVNTMAYIRVHSLTGWDFLRQQHNRSLRFYAGCLKKPAQEGKRDWERYLEEMRLTYNMLRDYQMQAYKSICGSLKIWLRYYSTILQTDTLEGCTKEFRDYAELQQQIVEYRFPEWHDHPALDFLRRDAQRHAA